jgi:hypothetical protein
MLAAALGTPGMLAMGMSYAVLVVIGRP